MSDTSSPTTPLIQDMQQANEFGSEMQQEATDNLYNAEVNAISPSVESPGTVSTGTPGS